MTGAGSAVNPHHQPLRLLATDLDGTLLSTAGTVSKRSRRALASVQAAGGVVVLITGRPSRMVLGVAEELGLIGHVICSNGAATHRLSDGAAEERLSLAPEILRRVIPLLRAAVPGIGLALEWGDAMAAEQSYRRLPESDGAADVPDILGVIGAGHPVLKVMARSARHAPPDLARLINACCGAEVHASTSGAPFAEIAAQGVDKGAALERLCLRLGVTQGQVIAFGDAPNDLPLLAWAGYGVAVANADQALLELADEVAPSNDADGVAVVVERLLDVGRFGP
ncbi:HAD family hydrolase [Deinococcus sp.]|uniref:Cof-type HAD-IIB family hydrolase n=1 Tax=Deinococcus sp. TaxID=47478 RepID=UPI0025D08374|nr:HAD family hydrolase [Deinococcus sp.]